MVKEEEFISQRLALPGPSLEAGDVMRETTDLWYLRLPDGRVFRAAGTGVVRQQLASGRLPANTRLRRSAEDEWCSVERYSEFADLAGMGTNGAGTSSRSNEPAAGSSTIASRLDSTQLRQVGVRGLFEELLAALDSTAVRLKLSIALWAGLIVGSLAGLLFLPVFSLNLIPPGPGWLSILGIALVVLWLVGVLTQLTFTELSRLHPARWSDGVKGIAALTCRLVVLQGGGWSVLAALVLFSRWLPGHLLSISGGDIGPAGLTGIELATVACVLIETLAWLFALLELPIASLLVVEGCSIFSGLSQWLGLLRQHFGRLLLTEGMALAIGLLLSAPAGLIVWVLGTSVHDDRLTWAVTFGRSFVGGMAGSLLFAYLVVANVFIYLHLRYESNGPR
jgi:hypothetical protein